MPHLYELVKDSKENKESLKVLVELFEPKIKKSLTLTNYQEKEDLAQELKCKLISCIQKYDINSTPGFWEMRARFENRQQPLQ